MAIMHAQPAAGVARCSPRLPRALRPQPSLFASSPSPVQHRQVRAAVSTTGFGAADDSEFISASIVEAPVLPPPSAMAPAAALNTTASLLEAELQLMFSQGVITLSRYDPDISFQDPVVRLKGRSAYAANIRLLRALFDIDFVLHKTETRQEDGIVTWWTMALKPRFILWRPLLTLTGQSRYAVDPVSGLINSHTDIWDSLEDNNYFSMEAFTLLLRGLFNATQTPGLEGPKYTVLRAADYQVRRYAPYLVAEVEMPAGAGPAAGDGFNDLAGYIFGGNNRSSTMEMTSPVYTSARQDSVKMEMTSPVFASAPQDSVKMEMTSPVFTSAPQDSVKMSMTSPVCTSDRQPGTTASQPGSSRGKEGRGAIMSFPMEARFGLDPDMLPTPNDSRVTTRLEGEKLVAAIEFDGWPLDWQVRAAERRLRGALVLDGIEAGEGYMLARYNDPFTLPQLRRNEILIPIVGEFEF